MLYKTMESGVDVNVPSFLFMRTLHSAMPQFAEKDEKTGEENTYSTDRMQGITIV